MKQKCKICGKNAESEYCFQHKPRKPIPKKKMGPGIYKQVKKGQILSEMTDKEHAKNVMKIMFITLWQTLPHYSEISGTYLGKEFSSIFFHHILPKSKYPEAMLDVENIVILTMDEHTNVENDMYRYEEINTRREVLKRKYNI